MFVLHDQQHITNWDDMTDYVMGTLDDYLSKVQLYHTTTRPLQLNDHLLFSHSADDQFDSADPRGSLFDMCQLQYRIAHMQQGLLYFDYVELFSAPANAVFVAASIVPNMRCAYEDTYLLRLFPDAASVQAFPSLRHKDQ